MICVSDGRLRPLRETEEARSNTRTVLIEMMTICTNCGGSRRGLLETPVRLHKVAIDRLDSTASIPDPVGATIGDQIDRSSVRVNNIGNGYTAPNRG